MKLRLLNRDGYLKELSEHVDPVRHAKELGVITSPTVFVPKILKKASANEGTVADFVISDASVDRERDTIKLSGWKLDNFRANPVVPFAHNTAELPVGQSLHVRRSGLTLMSKTQFTTREQNPFGFTVGQLVEGGFLRATSVGFMPTKWKFVEDEDEGAEGRSGGIDFLEQELLEHSIVPVPANANALIQASAAGIDLQLLKDWASRILDEKVFGDNQMLVARAYEDAYKQYSGGGQIYVEMRQALEPVAVAPQLEPSSSAGASEITLGGVTVNFPKGHSVQVAENADGSICFVVQATAVVASSKAPTLQLGFEEDFEFEPEGEDADGDLDLDFELEDIEEDM